MAPPAAPDVGPAAAAASDPQPAASAAEPPPPTPTSKVVIEWIGVLLPFTTVLTALAFWFGWTLTNARSRYLGVDASVFGFTPTDYILRSADAVIVPVILICLGGLVWVSLIAGVNVLLDRPAMRGPVRIGATIALAVALLGVLVALRAMFVGFAPGTHYLAAPLVLGVSALLAGTSASVLRRTAANPQLRLARLWGRGGVVFTATIVVASLFWASTLYADALGRGRGRDVEQQLDRLPSVVVYSAVPLGLEPPAEPQPVDDGGRYVIRYDGLRLLLKSDGSYFLLPDGWRSGEGPVIVLRDDGDIRLEFTAGGG
ncbi:hypothetical protein ACFPER_02185 [Agromyces aurantiacus]|uniref:Uncharacterized protein n=1 Tax=Agromyces aurantiacus TaxID=165814 RepID=A0ABV9R266_9MICO|nr:hypothetical protein [Agromyces aurantiacus]MBM7505896.1 hypothetical protein [Agromyces aurantiacus]